MRKFNDGDLVTIRRDNPKTPKWILRHVRLDHPRKIEMHTYNKKRQHTEYYLGFNGRGLDISMYPFMPSQLKLWVRKKVGRPKVKRAYKRN
jgi:hypothetical protein